MTAFIFQSALYLLLAYFAGCFLGCLARRSMFARQPALVPRPAVVTTAARPMPPPAATAAPEMSRFERALTTAGAPQSPAPAAQPVPPPVAAPVATPQPTLVVPPARPVIPAPAAPQTVSAPVVVPVAAPTAQPAAPEQAPAAAAAAAAAAVAAIAAKAAQAAASANSVLPSAMGSSGPATVTANVTPAVRPVPEPAPATPAAAPAPTAPVVAAAPVQAQDFTRIRAIDAAMQTALNGLGARTYADIANWKPDDVARVSSALKIPGRIEQENWIEQAQILAKGGETYYSRRKGQGAELARPTPDQGEKLTIRVPAATRPAEAAPAIEPAPTNDALKSAASAAAAAVQAAQAAVKPPAPAAIVAATPAEPTPAPVAAPAPAPAQAAETPVGLQRDPLQRIAGINAEVERLLNVQGVTRFAQIAAWSPSDISRFDRLLGFEGRIARENWIEQASILSKGGETAYARDLARRATEGVRPAKLADAIQGAASQATAAAAAPAVVAAAAAVAAPAVTPSPAEPVRSELSALRSVRSEAYRGPDSASSQHGREPDDLKRIRGVGVLIEKKLNGLGVTRYEQVANWTVADIERFSDKLDFKGRIERENWVEQARILSAGGQTEFSQRVDRGEVETSTRRPD